MHIQHAKKVMSESPGIVDFILYVPNRQEILPTGQARMTFLLAHYSLFGPLTSPPSWGLWTKVKKK